MLHAWTQRGPPGDPATRELSPPSTWNFLCTTTGSTHPPQPRMQITRGSCGLAFASRAVKLVASRAINLETGCHVQFCGLAFVAPAPSSRRRAGTAKAFGITIEFRSYGNSWHSRDGRGRGEPADGAFQRRGASFRDATLPARSTHATGSKICGPLGARRTGDPGAEVPVERCSASSARGSADRC